VSYLAASGNLTFTADPGEADIVSVSVPVANKVQIRVGNDDAIALTGDAVANANFVLSSFSAPNDTLTIATGSGQAPATTFVVNLGDQGDRLDFGLAATPNGVGSVAIDGQSPVGFRDTVTFTAPITVGKDLSITAEIINANFPIIAGGSVALSSFNNLDLSSSIVAGGSISVSADFGINLRANVSTPGDVSLFTSAGGVGQFAGTITANGLAASVGNTVGGSLTLDGAGNDVNVFAAYVARGVMRFADIDDVTVGTVGSMSGITVPGFTGDIVTSLATGGPITLKKDVACQSAVVLRPAAGGVVQTGGVVKGRTLVLLGPGPFVLADPGNDVAGIAADVTGPITYTDANDLSVSTFTTSAPYNPATVPGITTAGNTVSLTAGGNLVVGGVVGFLPGGPGGPKPVYDPAIIDVGPAGDVSLRSGGYMVAGVPPKQPNPHPGVFAANLAVSAGTGLSSNLWTRVARLEAQGRVLLIRNDGDLVIGGVDPGLSGISLINGGGQIILSCTGSLTFEEGVGAPFGAVSLTASGGVTQGPAGTISAAGLSVSTAAGDIVLGNANRVGVLAATNTTAGRSLLFVAAEDLTVGPVNYGAAEVPTGIKTNSGDATIRTGGGFTTQQTDFHDPSQTMINLGTGRFVLTPGQRDPQTLSTPSSAHTVVFDAEIIARSVQIGVPAGEAYANVFRDTFSIRPSANAVIDVQGNDPTSRPGDALSPIVPNGQGLTFIPGPNPASGTFIVNGRKPLTFAGIENASVVWDGGPTGQGTNWLDPVNWSGDVLPGSNDDVFIGPLAGGPPVVTLFAGLNSVQVHNLTVTGATLSLVSGVLGVAGNVTNSGTIQVTGYSGDRTLLIGTGPITNAPGGTIKLGRELAGIIDNQGTITVAEYAIWYNTGASTNSGTINVTGGNKLTLDQFETGASFVNTGAVTVAAGGTFTVTGGPYTQTGGTTTVAGTLSVSGAFGQSSGAAAIVLNGPIPGTEYGQIKVNGTVNLGGATIGAELWAILGTGFAPPFGTIFTIIDNDGTDAVSGTFAGLPQGATFTTGGLGFRISYVGGTGNDVTLTRVAPVPLASLAAYAVQTGPQTLTNPEPYVIEVQRRFASSAPGPLVQVIAPDDYPFIVSQALVVPFTAPRLAVADVNGDRLPDLIVVAGSNSAPLVTVVDGAWLFGSQAGQRLRAEDLLAQFVAYDPTFLGGVYVAAGDLNGDGRAEIVTGAGEGGGPHVRTFRYDAGATSLGDRMKPFAGPVGNFFAYDPAFRGGVRVAVGDVNGDGTADVVTGAGYGGGPHVRAFSSVTGTALLDFFAYDAAFRGGVYVAVGDIDGDGRADIVTGAGEGGGPHVKVFTGADAGLYLSFFAYDAAFRGGVRVAVGDWNGDGAPDIVTGAGDGGSPHVKVYSEVGGPLVGSFMAYDNSLRYGLYVAAGS
jgi:hypothetical protein